MRSYKSMLGDTGAPRRNYRQLWIETPTIYDGSLQMYDIQKKLWWVVSMYCSAIIEVLALSIIISIDNNICSVFSYWGVGTYLKIMSVNTMRTKE